MSVFCRAVLALAVLPAFVAPLHAQTSANTDNTCPPATADERVTLAFDAVELVKGNGEVEGSRTLWAAHGKYTYLFKDAANLATFKSDPAKYEIQWNGACGRMGPLSGAGSTKLPVVYDGKLYLCASPACKDTFQKHAAKLVERDDPRPPADETSRTRALAVLDEAAAAMGQGGAVDTVATYREVTEGTTDHEGKAVPTSSTFTASFPARFASRESWDTYAWGNVRDGDHAFQYTNSGTTDFDAAQRHALDREISHHWLIALRSRRAADVVLADAGEAEVEGVSLRLATIWKDGIATTLGVDKEGTVRCVRYRGRGPNLFFADIEERLSDFRTAGPLRVPYAAEVRFDGKVSTTLSRARTRIEVDVPVPAGTFDRPAATK